MNKISNSINKLEMFLLAIERKNKSNAIYTHID